MDEPVHFIVAAFTAAILYRVWVPLAGARQARKAQWGAVKKARKGDGAKGSIKPEAAKLPPKPAERELWTVPEEEGSEAMKAAQLPAALTVEPFLPWSRGLSGSQGDGLRGSESSRLPRRYLYVFGGRFRGRTLTTCERLDLDGALDGGNGGGWERVPNMRENRGSHGAGFLPGSADGVTRLPLVVCVGGGGLEANHSSCEALHVRAGPAGVAATAHGGGRREPKVGDVGSPQPSKDPLTGQLTRANPRDEASPWRPVAALAVPRHALAVCAAAAASPDAADGGGRPCLYAAGGWCFGKEGSCLIERFNFEAEVPEARPEARPEAEASGRCGFEDKGAALSSSSATGVIPAGRWTSLRPMPFPRRLHGLAACAADGCIYVFGGR